MSGTLASTFNKITNAAATKRASELLALDDSKFLALAIAEAAVEELQTNRAFAERVRSFYQQIAVVPSKQKASKGKKEEIKIVPIKRIEGREINPAAPLDPYFLLELYGKEQLPYALDRFPRQKLLEAIENVEKSNSSERLRNKSKATKDNLIQFILARLM